MSKPEWTKIGTVEVCVGTDGVIGVYWETTAKSLPDSVLLVICSDGYWSMSHNGTKAEFESEHCQPRIIIRHYADGSCVVESTERDEQGRPLRCAIVRTSGYRKPQRWGATWCSEVEWYDEQQDAIARAARYVETGE